MNPLAPYLTEFFHKHLAIERGVSVHTCDSYAYAFRLLLSYASERLKCAPSKLQLEQIDVAMVVSFLHHLETDRSNAPSSRNVRLAAIKSFMAFLQYRLPSSLLQIQQILAIPTKRAESRLVRHLSVQEMQAILDAPEPVSRAGVRDRAMLHLCFAAGLRVSELIGLQLTDLKLQPQPSVLVHGKGRRERCLPLWKSTTRALRAWLAVRDKEAQSSELFLNRQSRPMSRSGFEYILDKHVRSATGSCPSLAGKRVSPHVLRHTCALTVLQATKDLRKVALWLGHAHMQTTEIYTRADPAVKLDALQAMLAPELRSGHFRATDKLLASLSQASVMRSTIAPK